MISLFGSEPVKHQIDHGHVDHVFGSLGEQFVVFAETTVAIEPTKRPFDDPPLGQKLETLGGIAATNDLQFPTGELLIPV